MHSKLGVVLAGSALLLGAAATATQASPRTADDCAPANLCTYPEVGFGGTPKVINDEIYGGCLNIPGGFRSLKWAGGRGAYLKLHVAACDLSPEVVATVEGVDGGVTKSDVGAAMYSVRLTVS